jgi:cytochrome P450
LRCFADLVADRRANPRDDLTSQLVHGLYAGERPLTDDELERMLSLLMMGGLHTVQGTLAYSVIDFAKHPHKQDRLRQNRDAIPHAVEEMLRWEPPVWPSRRALKDTVVGGVEIKRDDMILCATAGANRDEAEFSEPDTVVLDRQPNRHLTFSSGPHRCIGSHLARLEIRVAFEELHRRLPRYTLDPDRPPIHHLGVVNGVRELHIRY